MKIKLKTIIYTIALVSVTYVSYVVVEMKLRDLTFATQVEPSFYQRQVIEDALLKEPLSLPVGTYEYTYYYESNAIIKTVWTFNKGHVDVKGYLLTHFDVQVNDKQPSYEAKAIVQFNGAVMKFSEIEGNIGLFPKYGLPIKEINRREILLDTSDESHISMYKYRIPNEHKK